MTKTSWVDRLAGPDSTLFSPSWLWIPFGWIAAGLLEAAPRWVDGSLPVGTFDRYALSDPFYIVAPIAAYAYLSRTARRAYDRFAPALATPAPDARHRLASSTTRTATIALAIGGVIGVASYHTDPGYADLLASSMTTRVIFYALAFVGFGMHIVLGALVVRQLHLVARLHRDATHIDLFLPEPLHAFASLTARAGAVVLGVAMYSALTDPTTFTNPVWRTVFVIAMVLAAAAFFLPLTGLSRRLRAEKRALSDASSARLSALTRELDAAVDARRLNEIGDLRAAIDAVVGQQDRIRKMSAWPWETATIRGFATTLLLPITTWFVTSLLSRSLGL